MIQVNVLIDNLPSSDTCMLSEHGLSFYIETGSRHILCDMGSSENFMHNAYCLGIDLKKIDFAFLSHGHADHTGGLKFFLESYPSIPVYLSEDIWYSKYYSSRGGAKRDISMDSTLFSLYTNCLNSIKVSRWLTTNVAAVYTNFSSYPSPYGNQYLTKVKKSREMLDDFEHELSLAILTDEGLVIVSSCSHKGILNIIQSCCEYTGERRVLAYIGGLHLVDTECVYEETNHLVEYLLEMYPDINIYTGHCTCDKAKDILDNSPLNVRFFTTGEKILI